MREYPMDISAIIGEDGSGKDIGTGMKDGGKTDTEDTMTDMSRHHLHRLDALGLHHHHLDALGLHYHLDMSDLRIRPGRLLSLTGSICGDEVLRKDPVHK
jgi:hypothetical protein